MKGTRLQIKIPSVRENIYIYCIYKILIQKIYYYREWKEKLEVVDNVADDTMEYNPRDTFIFDQEKSGKLTGEEVVTVPHPLIVVSNLDSPCHHMKIGSLVCVGNCRLVNKYTKTIIGYRNRTYTYRGYTACRD